MANYKIGVDFEANGSKAISAINQVSQAMQNLQNQVGISSRGTQTSVDTLTLSLRNLSGAFAGFLSLRGLAGFVSDSLKATASLEQMAVSFQVFTGSAKVAGELMAQFKEQAIKSPMQFQDIVQGGKVLMNYGITAQQVIPLTKMLGDISGGNADRFSRLALAFGQVNGAGRLMGQELRQMINAGFNPLQAISLRTGESMSSLTKRMRDGQISVREVGQAFVYATTEGGLFYKNAELQANTLAGKYAKFAETIYFSMAEVGKSIAKALNIGDLIDYTSNKLTGLVDSFRKVNDEVNANSPWSKLGKTIIDLGDIALRNLGSTLNDIKNSFSSVLSVIFNIIDGIKIMGKGLADFTKNVPILGKITGALSNFLGVVQGSPSAENKSKVSVMPLAPMKKKDPFKDFLASLNGKPTGVEKTIKESNSIYAKGWNKLRDTIFGTDFVPKTLADDYRRLVKINEDAGNRINEFWDNSTAEKLIILDANYKKEIAKFEEFNSKNKGLEIDYTNVTKKYEADRLQIVEESKQKLIDARKKAREIAFGKEVFARQIKEFQDGIYMMKTFGQKSAEVMNTLFNEDLASNVRNYSQSVYSAFKDFNVNLIAGASELVGNALATGQGIADTFKAFGSLILDSLGDALIKIGTSAIAAGTVGTILKTFFSGGLTTVPELGIAGGMAAVAVGTAMKALSGKVKDSMSMNQAGKAQSSANSISQRASGSSYQYGGSSYATQTVKLQIDLTGAITASPTGYNINKSLETVLRVTGR